MSNLIRELGLKKTWNVTFTLNPVMAFDSTHQEEGKIDKKQDNTYWTQPKSAAKLSLAESFLKLSIKTTTLANHFLFLGSKNV